MQIGDYIVKPNSIRDENALIRFLESNDFTYANDFENNPLDREYLIVVNIIRRTYFRIDRYCLTKGPMPLADFYRRVRHRSCENIVRKRLYFEDGKLLYEGYAVNDRPYGFGTVYFANGNRYQEGIFDIKGLVEGREYYPDGKLKFEGIWRITTG